MKRLACGNSCSFLSLALIVGCGGPSAPATQPPATATHSAAPRAALDDDRAEAAVSKPAGDGYKKDTGAKAAISDLNRALDVAKSSLNTLKKVKDYTARFCKRERVGDTLLPEECNAIKLRHKPFSVYLRVLEPAPSAGQEVIYVAGRNNGKLIAHTTGFGSKAIGRVSLDPHGFIATRGNRYTIKDVGLENLVRKLIELGEQKELFRESKVTIEKTEFNERPCMQMKISSPKPVGDFRLAIARIVLDSEWNVPVHYESHEWPAGGGEKPVLTETYSYYDLKFDVGLDDHDFDPDNSEYAFP